MKIAKLLSIASKCTTASAAVDLGLQMEAAFARAAGFRRMESANADYNLEESADGDTPHVRVEYNRVISGAFIIAVIPEIRDGKFAIYIDTNAMKDGHGMSSHSSERVASEDISVSSENQLETVTSLAKQAMRIVKEQHQTLLENAGLSRERARRAANAW